MMKSFNQLFQQVIGLENLTTAYRNARKRKSQSASNLTSKACKNDTSFLWLQKPLFLRASRGKQHPLRKPLRIIVGGESLNKRKWLHYLFLAIAEEFVVAFMVNNVEYETNNFDVVSFDSVEHSPVL